VGERTGRVSPGGGFDDVRASGAFDSPGGGGADEPAAIAGEIEQTRAEMSETIEAIQDRLAPERVAEQAKDTAVEVTAQARDAALEVVDHALEEAKAAVRELTDQAKAAVREATVGRVERVASRTGEAAGGFRSSVMTTIQQNPIPAALVGLGLGWMMLNRPSSSQGGSTGSSSQSGSRTGYTGGYPYQPGSQMGYAGQSQSGGTLGQAQEKAGQAVDQVQQTAGQVAGQVQQTAGQVVDQVQETAGQVVNQVQETASQARGRLEQMLHENPVQVGAAALLLGGVLGLAKPPTQREQQLMGPARDRLVDQAQEAAQGTMQKVQRVAEEAGDAAEDEARHQGLAPER